MYSPCENCLEPIHVCRNCLVMHPKELQKANTKPISTREKLTIRATNTYEEELFYPLDEEKQDAMTEEKPMEHFLDSMIFLIEEGIIDGENYNLLSEDNKKICPKGTLNKNFGNKKAFIYIDDEENYGYVGFPDDGATSYLVDEKGNLLEVIDFLIEYGFEAEENFKLIRGTNIFDMLKED